MKKYPPINYLFALFIVFSTTTIASVEESAISKDKNAQAYETPEIWEKPMPIFDHKYDWVRLNSNEWLKGNIIVMYDDMFEFDSEEFGILTLDWEDVIELRSRYDQSIRLRSGETVEGFLIVENNEVSVISGGNKETFPLSELLTITSSSESRIGLWDGDIKLGLNFLKGNVGQRDYSITSTLQRRTTISRLRFDFVYNYSKLDGTNDDEDILKANTSRFTMGYDWLYTPKVFFRLIDLEISQDELQNIKSRNTLGLAFGYHFIDTKRILWDATIGPSYQETIYFDSFIETHEKSAVLSLNTLLEYEVTSDIDLSINYQLQFVNKQSGERLHSLTGGLSFDLAYDIDVDFTVYIDRVAEPIAKESGDIPDQDDIRTVISLGYSF